MTSSPSSQTRLLQQHQLPFRRSMSPTGSSCSDDDEQRSVMSKFGLTLGTGNGNDLQQAVAAQQAVNAAAAAEIVRKFQQQHQQQLQQQTATNATNSLSNGNGFNNYNAYFNMAAAMSGADVPLLSSLNGLTGKGSSPLNGSGANGSMSSGNTSGLGSQSSGSKNSGAHSNGSNGPNSSGTSTASPYVATNECRVIEYRGARIAAFLTSNKTPAEYLLCLPQAFELFLKHLVGGLHTVYTKLKVRISLFDRLHSVYIESRENSN